MTIMQKTTAFAAAAGLAVSFAAVPAAMAQTAPSTSSQSMAPGSSSPDLDKHKLKSFAVAYLQVDKIKREYQPKLAKAGSKSEKDKIQTEASHKMVAAVNDVDDMNVREYSKILASAQKDPNLAKQLSAEINKTAKSGQ